MAQMIRCPSCGQSVGVGHKYCGSCGQPLAGEHTGGPGGPRARLRLIRGDGQDGLTFQLLADELIAGRTEGSILFPEDPTVSPTHARFFYRDGRLFVRDEGSRNGTFIRVYDPIELKDGERFLCGEQLVRFETYKPPSGEALRDGSLFGGTPLGPWQFRLVQLLQGSREGRALCSMKDKVAIGREDCDMNFLHDRFISRFHSRVERDGGRFLLCDLDSRNGTFIQIHGDWPLNDNDYLFIGRQLVRVEFG